MHIYSRWGMERLCGMITRTAKLRVATNRNMEITLLMTEQKHMLGYVLNEVDWPTAHKHHKLVNDIRDSESDSEPEARGDNIEDADGNLSLTKAFAHRIAVSRPEAVRTRIRTPLQQFNLIGRVKSRPPQEVEGQRIREFMAGLQNYDRDQMPIPTSICLWRWCAYRSAHDNKKEDFKVTSRALRRANNSRNASFVAYKDSSSEGQLAYGEVQFFFSTQLPSELRSENAHDVSRSGDSDFDSEDERTGTALHQLAYIRKISLKLECEDSLVRKVGSG